MAEASNQDNRGRMEVETEHSSFSPLLVRQNSIQRCYGSPSVDQRRAHASKTATREITTTLRWTTNVSALVSAFLFAGIIFGWAPLKLILIREGQYHELCATDTDDKDATVPCATQMDRFNVIFTLAQFFLSFASLPAGFFLDYFSKTVHYGLAAVFQVGGLILFGLSDSSSSQPRDFFVLSYCLMALGGCMTMLGAFPASFLLPKHQAGILAAISCLFDASSIVFAVFYRLNVVDDKPFSRPHLFVIHAIIGLVIYALLSYSWALLEKSNWKTVLEGEENQQNTENSGAAADVNEETTTSNATDLHSQRIRRLGMHECPLLRQLRTFEFLLVLLFASVHMTRCNFYIETVNEILATMGDNDASYANLFSFVLPSGIVFVPLIEWTVRRFGVVRTLHFTNALGLLFGSLLLVPSLYVQAVNFLIFACFRAYLYATLNTFIALTFGVSTMGRVIGSTFTTAAVVTLLQYPAAALAEIRHHGDFTVVNIIMLSACAVPIGLVLVYSRSIHPSERDGERRSLLASKSDGSISL